MSLGIIGIDPTQVSTTPQFALGVRGAVEDQTTGSGTKEYIYVSFAASTAVAAGAVVLISGAGAAAGATTTNAAPGNAAGRRVGVVPVAVSSVASVQYGWVQVYGIAATLAAAAAAINTRLNTTATAGAVDDDGTAGARVIDGLVFVTAATGAGTFNASLNYPFVGVTL